MAEKPDRIIMFPFMAQGHIIPFLSLAFHLQQTRNYTIIFVNTPLNIKKLKSTIPQNPQIQLLEIPFNSSDHGLPPNTENTDSLPYNLILQFLQSSLSLKPTFRKLVSGLVNDENGEKSPICLISDIFFSWSAEVAAEFGIFHSVFCAGGAFGFACFYSLWVNLPHRSLKSENEEFLLPDFPEAGKFDKTCMTDFLREAKGDEPITVFEQEMLENWEKSDGILVNTMEDFDRIGLSYFRRKLRRPVWAIGPVISPPENREKASPEILNWLDEKPANSVLYICFGSQNTISGANLMNLATALEKVGIFFIWVVRPPLGFDINSEFRQEKWLPAGFEGRVIAAGRGLLVPKWAAQMGILGHKSVGGFLSHCGWNSVVESLVNGVPIIGWPLAAEQFYNSRFLEAVAGVCVEIGRGKIGEIGVEKMEGKIEMVMKGEKGREMRRKACEVKEMMKMVGREEDGFKGSSVAAIDEFLSAALVKREKMKMGV